MWSSRPITRRRNPSAPTNAPRQCYCYPFRSFADASGYVSARYGSGDTGALWAFIVNDQAELDRVTAPRVPNLLPHSLADYYQLNQQPDSYFGGGQWILQPLGGGT